MQWFSSWWGIEISAENEEDEALLRKLLETLPRQATDDYEDGMLEARDKATKKFHKLTGFTLTFHR